MVVGCKGPLLSLHPTLGPQEDVEAAAASELHQDDKADSPKVVGTLYLVGNPCLMGKVELPNTLHADRLGGYESLVGASWAMAALVFWHGHAW